MALALILGNGQTIFELLKYRESCTFYQKKCQLNYIQAEDAFLEDQSWSSTPEFRKDDLYDESLRIPVETSFMLALKHNRFRALDHIFTANLKLCMTELATKIKKNPILNRKWNLYLGLDLYLPVLLIWCLLRENERPDVKKRLVKGKGFASLPYFQFKEVLKYI